MEREETREMEPEEVEELEESEEREETDETTEPNIEIDVFFNDRMEVLVNKGTFGSKSIINLPKPPPKGPEEAE